MVSRRTVLSGLGGAVIGGTAIATLGTENAHAQVSFGSLNVANREYEQTSELKDVHIRVNGNYKFDSEEQPDAWSLKLHVGKNGEYTEIAEERLAPRSNADSGTEELEGSILDTSYFAIENFQLGDNQSEITETINVKLTFQVFVGDREIASASVEDTADLTVTHGTIEASAQLKGNGEIVLIK